MDGWRRRRSGCVGESLFPDREWNLRCRFWRPGLWRQHRETEHGGRIERGGIFYASGSSQFVRERWGSRIRRGGHSGDQPSTAPHQHLLIGGGKEGNLFLLDRDNMGGYGANFSPADSNAVQKLLIGGAIFSTAAFFNNGLYVAGSGGPLEMFTFDTGTGQFNPAPASQSPATFGFPGPTPSVSAAGANNAIVWATDSRAYGSSNGSSQTAGPAILHAYDATNLGTELWNSSMAPANRDLAGNCVKFTVPTVANGKVYVGTRGNDTTTGSGTIFGEIDVYGLLPN